MSRRILFYQNNTVANTLVGIKQVYIFTLGVSCHLNLKTDIIWSLPDLEDKHVAPLSDKHTDKSTYRILRKSQIEKYEYLVDHIRPLLTWLLSIYVYWLLLVFGVTLIVESPTLFENSTCVYHCNRAFSYLLSGHWKNDQDMVNVEYRKKWCCAAGGMPSINSCW